MEATAAEARVSTTLVAVKDTPLLKRSKGESSKMGSEPAKVIA